MCVKANMHEWLTSTYIPLVFIPLLVSGSLDLVMDVSECVGTSGDSPGVMDLHACLHHSGVQLVVFPSPTPEQVGQSIHLNKAHCVRHVQNVGVLVLGSVN